MLRGSTIHRNTLCPNTATKTKRNAPIHTPSNFAHERARIEDGGMEINFYRIQPTSSSNYHQPAALSAPHFDGVVQRSGHEPVVEDVERPHAGALEHAVALPVRTPDADGVIAACGHLRQKR